MNLYVQTETPRTRRLTDRRTVRNVPGLARHVVLLRGPGGVVFDITARIEVGGIGTITESTEEDFLELAHGDVELEIDNADGAMDRFFSGVQPTDLYEVTIDRAAESGRLRYDRLFGGVLDLPWSLTFDRAERICRVQAFSFSKLLERTSGETVRRTFAASLVGTVAAASKNVTGTDTAGMLPGDEITMISSSASETQVIATVTGGTTLTTVTAWTNAFTAASMTVDTPYYRNKPPEFLSVALFTAAGVTIGLVPRRAPLSAFPVPTPMNNEGLAPNFRTTFMIRAGKIAVNDRAAVDPRSAWINQGYPNTFAKVDWTGSRDVEPAAVYTTPDGEDNGRTMVNWATGDIWDYRAAGANFHLSKNGVQQGPDGVAFGTNFESCCEFPPEAGQPWFSHVRATSGGTKDGKLMYWDGAAFQDIDASHGGFLRYLRRLKLVAFHEFDPGTGGSGGSTIKRTTNLHLYDPATRLKVKTVTVPLGLLAWTLRVFGDWIGALYALGPTTRLIVWNKNWSVVADLEVAQKASVYPKDTNLTAGIDLWTAYLTVFTEPDTGIEVLCGAAGGQIFVAATYFAGVFEYADFSGLSVAGALREVALGTISYVNVDHQKIGNLKTRLLADPVAAASAPRLDAPIDNESWPLWEFYRTSAEVTGRTSAGDEISKIAGDTGDSQHRMSISSQLIQSDGLAEVVATFYVGLLSRKLRQEEVTVHETGQLLHVLDFVRMDGIVWLIVELSLDVEERQHDLRLIEVPA